MQNQQQRLFTRLNNASSRLHMITLVCIIILGFLLRFSAYYVGEGYHYFSINDEVSAFRVAMSFLGGEERAYYIGQPNFSNGHAPGPAFTLFTVLALKLAGGSADQALLFMVFINTLVIYLIYLLGRQFLQPSFALFAGFLFAISPWPVYYGPGLWNPIPLAFLGASLFLSLWQVSQTNNSRMILLVCLVSAVIPHFHMIGLFYLPAVLLILYFSPARINRVWFIAGILAGLAVYLPYLIGEMQHDWENTRKILSGAKEFSFSALKIITAPATVLSNHPGRWAGDVFAEFIEFGDRWFGSYILLLIINLMSMILSLTIIIRFLIPFFSSLKKNWRNLAQAYQQQPVLFFIGILLVVPPALFFFTGHNYSTRYTILIFPLLFLLPAFFLQYAKNGKFKRIYTATLPVMILINIYVPIAFFTHQNQQIANENYLITSFRKLELIRQQIKAHAGPESFISVDTEEYYKDAPVKFEKAGKALTDYIDIYETYIEHERKPAETRHYRLSNLDQFNANTANIAYQGEGFVIATRP